LSRGFEADQINKALRQLEMPDEDEI
jgi:hypothetical protein